MKGFLLLVLLCPLISFAGSKVIYGEDNRVDVYMADSFYQELAHSTAAMMLPTALVQKGEYYQIKGVTLINRGMCPSERFSNQIAAARCSGFLVGDDLLMTAGHCVSRQADCNDYAWVFDYAYNPDSSTNYFVGEESIYRCKEIIDQELDSYAEKDYALIRLDRKVVDRKPLKYRTSGKIDDRTALAVIGHPTGLPTKVATGAHVRKNDKEGYFVANLDTYGGNSGSAVFDAYTGLIEGILVRGESDWVYNATQKCSVSRVCTNDGCRGEDVSRITSVKKLMEI